jgi:hypothetical protein
MKVCLSFVASVVAMTMWGGIAHYILR